MTAYVSVANTVAGGMAGQWCIVFSEAHSQQDVITIFFFSEYCSTQSGCLWCLIGESQSKTCCQGLLFSRPFTDVNWPLGIDN